MLALTHRMVPAGYQRDRLVVDLVLAKLLNLEDHRRRRWPRMSLFVVPFALAMLLFDEGRKAVTRGILHTHSENFPSAIR